MRARREEDARKKVASDAARILTSANARFRKAERTADSNEAARLRLEGEERLKDLATVDPAAWPWAKWMYAVRDTEMLVPAGGEAPVYEGLRIASRSPWNPEKLQHAEFGRVKGAAIGVREAGSVTWSEQPLEKVAALGIRPEHLDQAWPAEDDSDGGDGVDRVGAAVWRELAGAGMVAGVGRVVGAGVGGAPIEVIGQLAKTTSWYAEQQRVPVVVRASCGSVTAFRSGRARCCRPQSPGGAGSWRWGRHRG